MERRTDQGPDYNQLSSLSQGLGTVGGGTTGSLGGTGGSTTGLGGSVGTAGNLPGNQLATGIPGYNPIYNTGQQGQQQQPQESSRPAVGMNDGSQMQAGEDPVAWVNRINPAGLNGQRQNSIDNAANRTGVASTAGPTGQLGVPGQAPSYSLLNPWTQQNQSQKAGQTNQQQDRINMLSSGIAPATKEAAAMRAIPSNWKKIGNGAYRAPGAQVNY